jgi:predicted P-loop ATPase
MSNMPPQNLPPHFRNPPPPTNAPPPIPPPPTNGHANGHAAGHHTAADIESHVKAIIDGYPEMAWEDTELHRMLALGCQPPRRRQGRAEIDRIVDRIRAKYPKDFRSSHFENLIAAELEILENAARERAPKREGWKSKLILKSSKEGDGTPAACVTNALLYFENHEEWAGKLAWNEFTGEPLVVDDLPIGLKAGEPVRDHHDTLVQSWFEKETRDPKWNIDTIRRSVDCWAKAHGFNPVKDYLNGLDSWDGVERLGGWLFKYCGAQPALKDENAEGFKESLALCDFIAAIGERWWISAIARIFQPGCKVHHVLVFEGAKGIGKTSVAESIFGEWWTMIDGDIASKDNQALLSSGVWGVMLDEMSSLGKSDMRAMKSWVTKDFEKFRPTWGHRHEKRLRQCVFIANVNESEWAPEPDRRWWPVACKKSFDLVGLKRDRDMLMAEALHRYRAGQRWYFDDKEDAALIATARGEQAARVVEDVNADSFVSAAYEAASSLGEWHGTCSVDEVLRVLKIPMGRERSGLGVNCGKALCAARWVRFRPRVNGEQKVRYRKPVEAAKDEDDKGD